METPLKAKTALEKSAATRERSSASNSALSARSRRRSFRALATVVAGAFFATVASVATAGKAQAAPKPRLNYVPGELLVKYKINPRSQTAARINSFANARALQTFDFLQAQHVKIPANMTLNQAMAVYLGQSKVESVQPNYRYVALQTPNDPLYKNMYGLPKISAPAAWDVTTGDPNYKPTPAITNKKGKIDKEELVIAVIDTGVNISHVDLVANIWRNVKEIPGNGKDDDKNGYIDDVFGIDALDNDSFPNDDVGHGTHVAGTLGAVGNNNLGVTGVNWRIKIMPLRFLGNDGGSTSGAITCMQYMLRMKKKGVNIRVANHSWGPLLAPQAGATFDPLLRKAFKDTEDAGILNVVAAGNGDENGNGQNNDGLATFPANLDLPGILTVAATDSKDNPAGFTNFGLTTVDLAAPGVHILSTFIQGGEDVGDGNLVGSGSNSTYAYLSGTSMATPHVAGSAALIVGKYPNLSVQQLHDVIVNNVDVLPQLQGLTVSGGRLNVAKALAAAANVPAKGGGKGKKPKKNKKPKFPFPPGGGNPSPAPTATGTGVTPTATGTGVNPTATAEPTETPTPFVTPTPMFNNGTIIYTSGNGFGSRQIQSTNGATNVGSSRTNFNPSQSYQTGRLAFAANLALLETEQRPDRDEIFVADADGSNQLRLTNDDQLTQLPVDDREPAISPDGRFIVFASLQSDSGKTTDSFYRLFVIPASLQSTGFVPVKKLFLDGNPQGIQGNFQNLHNPTFNQDGTRIAFQSDIGRDAKGQPSFDIFTVGFDKVNGTAIPNSVVRVTNDPADDQDPTFGPVTATSPNGQLAFASSRSTAVVRNDDDPPPNYNIYRLADPGPETPGRPSPNPAIPVTDFGSGNLNIGPPNFSIIVSGDEDKAGGGTFLIPNFRFGDALHPSFSPDGISIAFTFSLFTGAGVTDDPNTTNPDNDFEIFITSVDSRNFFRVTNNTPTRDRKTGNFNFAVDSEPFWGAVVPAQSEAFAVNRPAMARGLYAHRAPVSFSSGVVTSIGTTSLISLQSEGATAFTVMANPENGVLRGDGATRIYTPIPGFVGTDQFTYRAENAAGQSEIATVKIDVKAPEMPRARIGEISSNLTDQTVAVTFANALDAASAANAQRYSVFINGKPTDIESGQFSSIDNALTLTLPQGTLHKGDKVIVQWEKLRNFEGKTLLDGKAQFTVR